MGVCAEPEKKQKRKKENNSFSGIIEGIGSDKDSSIISNKKEKNKKNKNDNKKNKKKSENSKNKQLNDENSEKIENFDDDNFSQKIKNNNILKI